MPPISNPALDAFARVVENEFVFAQLLIRATNAGFDLRHADDAALAAEQLKPLAIDQLRAFANQTAAGKFRPLKSAPDLPSGWRAHARGHGELEFALNQIYPGALADWHAAQTASPPVTNFREFTERQTGMYRIAYKLSDTQAARVIRAACHRRFCLKQRLWSVTGLGCDNAADKSAIPCLEPCAVLLEFARKAMRVEQEEQISVSLARSDWNLFMTELDQLTRPGERRNSGESQEVPEPRRLEWLAEKIREQLNAGTNDR